MDRRVLIFGGVGLLGAVAVGAYLRPEPQQGSPPAPKAQAGRPTLVFVGHEL